MTSKRIKVFPSLLSADYLFLDREIKAPEKANVDGLHFDVMDGHFVPNLSMGTDFVKKLRPATSLSFYVHLMIKNPGRYLKSFIDNGADYLTIHVENNIFLYQDLQMIVGYGKKAGVALNPGTSVFLLEPILHLIDHIVIMTVNPGFSGQKFISSIISKISAIKNMCQKSSQKIDIIIDGGVNFENIIQLADIGIGGVVTGNTLFSSSCYRQAVKKLREPFEKTE